MRKVIFCSLFISYAGAIPTMAIPNLVFPNSVIVTPSTIYNDDSGAATSSKPGVNPAIITKQFKNQLPGFNADVRGAIISSGQFKVVRMPKQDSIWNGNTQPVLDLVKNSSATSASNTASKPVAGNSVTNNSAKGNMPDYILLGKVSAITQNEDTTPVKYTDKNTNQYNIDIAVDYKLIKTSDDSIMASFTAYGHASDVKILTVGNTSQVQTHNIPLLMQTASKSLGADVISQLGTQFGISSENYDNGSRVITDVKVYKD